MAKSQTPEEVTAIRNELKRHLDLPDTNGRKRGSAKYGVYVFYDYDESRFTWDKPGKVCVDVLGGILPISEQTLSL